MRIEQGVKVFYGEPNIKKVTKNEYFLIQEIAQELFWLYRKIHNGFLLTGISINKLETAIKIAKMLNDDLRGGE